MTDSFAAMLEQDQREREAMMVELSARGIDPSEMNVPQMRAALQRVNKGGLYLRRLDSYQTREVKWLRKPFFQGSAFHLLAGKKGQGKGTFLAGLAARVTTGRMYQDEARQVLLVTSEDSIELDFRPRFLAADGEPMFLHVVNGDFRLPRDIPFLKQAARQLGEDVPLGLVAIDPLGNHLSDKDTDGEGAVRNAIGPLNHLADELDCMVFGVRHLTKSGDGGALASVLGSTAWVDVPRCVIVMARDDEDEMVFHAQVVAGNRGPRSSARAFRMDIVDIDGAREITFFDGIGDSDKEVDELLAAPGKAKANSKSAKARGLILEILDDAGGVMASDELDARVAVACGIEAKTVRNLRAELKGYGLVVPLPDKDEFGTVTGWSVKRTNVSASILLQGTSSARPEPDERLPGDYGVAA